ncbi:MAG: hypothetical protein SGJ02_13410 [bacterium]|nr:hypothetical protein [bacterium]
MSGFRSKVGDFASQFAGDDSSYENSLKIVSQEEYSKFLSQKGGPHKIEGLLDINSTDSYQEYLNVRKSSHSAGEVLIEPISRYEDRYVVAENPNKISGYRFKLTSGAFNPEENSWEFQYTTVLEIAPGVQIDLLHKQLDLALRTKLSLAERFLKGEEVSKEVAIYSNEQPFYKGGFGEILKRDPIREPYLRDAILSEIQRILENNDHKGVKEISVSNELDTSKITYEVKPKTFMKAPLEAGTIRVQKVGAHYILIFKESRQDATSKTANKSEILSTSYNQFELHGGRAEEIFHKISSRAVQLSSSLKQERNQFSSRK